MTTQDQVLTAQLAKETTRAVHHESDTLNPLAIARIQMQFQLSIEHNTKIKTRRFGTVNRSHVGIRAECHRKCMAGAWTQSNPVKIFRSSSSIAMQDLVASSSIRVNIHRKSQKKLLGCWDPISCDRGRT